jgi:hypothetical protein
VVFIEVGMKFESEVVQKKNNPEKVRFELKNEEKYFSDESTESDEEVEQPNPITRKYERVIKPVERYIPPNFCSSFVLTATHEEPKSIREKLT